MDTHIHAELGKGLRKRKGGGDCCFILEGIIMIYTHILIHEGGLDASWRTTERLETRAEKGRKEES